MSTAGQCKVNPTTGIAGTVYGTVTGDGDAGFLADVTTSGSTDRKCLGALIQALVSGLLGAGIVGQVTITTGNSSVVATNSAITSSSLVIAIVSQATADATLTQIVRVSPGSGTCTIYGNANATGNVNVVYAVLN